MNNNKDQFISEESLSTALDSRFVKYAFKSLEDRALPDARDGLKPSQRRVIYSMYDLKLFNNSGTEKCAKITGFCSGNYHPHGDMVVYPTLVRMVQPWVLRYPLCIGQGNFGNLDGDPPAAQRYTESKLSKFGEMILDDVSSDVVNFVSNYNEKLTEPTVLPSLIPNLLVNGCEGIAVGWATKMPSHNLKEIVNLIKEWISNPNITAEEAIKIVPGPDFPTGGKILGKDGILDYFKTGRGKLILEGNYTLNHEKRKITITALPYQINPDQFTTQLEALVDSGKIQGISDLKNLSSKKTGVCIVLDISKNGNLDLILNQLLKNTCLRTSFAINQTVLIDGKVVPDVGILKLVEVFVNHRVSILTKKFNAELNKSKSRIHILEGLIRATSKIDRIIQIVRESSSPEEAATILVDEMIVHTPLQAQAVLSITLRQLTKLEETKLNDELKNLNNRVSWLNKVLKDKKEILSLIVKEQEELANKYGDERRTKIIKSIDNIEDEDLIKDEQLMISLTGDGYVKSMSIDMFKIQNRGGVGSLAVSKNDNPENMFELFESNSKDLILFFSNFGLVYQRKAYEIPQTSKTGKGTHLSNLLNLKVDEQITNMLPLKNLDQKGYLVIITKKGMVKKTEISEYNTNRKNSGIQAISLKNGDEVAFAAITDGKKDVFIVTQNGQYVRYSEKLISKQGRATRGIKALKLDSTDKVVQFVLLDNSENLDVLVVTSKGFGKKTSSSDYKGTSSRVVKGSSVIKKQTLDKNGKLIGAVAIAKNDSLLIMTSSGKCLRINSETIRETARTTSGVKMVKIDDSEFISKISKIKFQ